MNENNIFVDFEPLGFLVNELGSEKTAADKAGETLGIDSYLSGLEVGMGVPDGMLAHEKVACQELGREIMMDFIPSIFLSHKA